jgi:hypothetical protein
MWNAFLERRKRVDMMSAALMMAVGGDKTMMRSATSGRVESGEMNFAQSFGERAGLAVDVQTMNGAGEASSEMRGGKSSGLWNNSDAPPLTPTGAKANAVVDQRVTDANETKSKAGAIANSAGKSVVGGMDLAAPGDASGRGLAKTTPVQLPADRGELQQKNIVANVVAQASVSQTKATGTAAVPAVVSNDVLAAESTSVDSVQREGTALADHSSLQRDEVEPTVQNETELAGKTLDVASPKKDVKTQVSTVGAKAVSKATETTGSAKTGGDASIVTGMQGAIPLQTQVAAPSDGQPNTVGITAVKVLGVLGATAGERPAGVATAGADNTGRKAMVGAAKEEVETTEQDVNPAAGATVATGFGAEIDKAAAVTSAAGKDAGANGLSAVGATAALVHTATGSEAVASGVVAGMTSGHAPVEISGTKVQAGEAGAHAVTPQAGLVEQDGSGVAAAETGMSHRTLLATPMALEVGVTNGTQGWLKIRAEMTDGGVVNASLSSATSAGQEMLHRELPALTAYLQEERVAVNTVVVPANATAGTDSRFAGGMNGDGSEQAQQSSGQRGGDERQGSIHGSADRADEGSTFLDLNGVGEDGLYSAGMYAGGGSWLNVRA